LLICSGNEVNRKFNGHSDIAAALALHERTGSTETASGTLEVDWLVKNKVGAQGKGASYRLLAVNHGNSNCTLVAGSGANAAQNLGRQVLVHTVDYYGFESGAGQPAHGRISIGTGFNPNFEIAQHTAQHPHDLVVGAKNQRIQVHTVTASPGSINPSGFVLSFFFIQQVRDAANLLCRGLQSFDLFAQLRLLGLFLAQHFMDVLHVEPPIRNVGFAGDAVNEGWRSMGYGRNPVKTRQLPLVGPESQAG
jgi:hypothetical protein